VSKGQIRCPASPRGKALGAALALVVVLVAPAAALAFGPPEVSFAALRARYAAPSSQFLELAPGLVVHVRDEGPRTAPPLVLVHGFAASAADWDPWIARLDKTWRIVALDLPGHGLTEAPPGYRASISRDLEVVDAVARRLDLPRFVLIGNSMGGEVAWRYALERPERLCGLVLVDAAGWPERPRPGGALLFSLMRLPMARALLKTLDERPLARQGLKAALIDETLVTPELVDRYVAFARAPGHKDILLSLDRGPKDVATPAALAQIAVPTLVMVGAKDRLIPPGDGRRFADAIPGAELVAFPDAGHLPMEQIPGPSAAALEAFLQKTSCGASTGPPGSSPNAP
jgi:pimeloyl-ACP methyl ester carboxylesterase